MTFTGGIAYDSSAVDDDNRTVTVPMGEVWVRPGAQYSFKPNLTLGAAYEFAWLATCPLTSNVGPWRERVSGEFGNSTFNFFGLNLKWTY